MFNFSKETRPVTAGIYYGRSTDNKPQFFQGDEHFLLIGPTRSGKGRRILAPNLILDCNRSALVIDPKGELAGWTAAYRRDVAKHEIVYLDPFGVLAKDPRLAVTINGKPVPAESHGFNPLRYLDSTSMDFVDDAMGVAEALVQIESVGGESYWSASAQDFVAGLVMAEVANAKNKNEAKNEDGTPVLKEPVTPSLNEVRRIICLPSDQIANTVAGACQDHAKTLIPNKLARFMAAGDGNRRDLASIISTAQTETRFLDSPLVAYDVEGGDFDFGEMKNRLITVYLVLPASKLVTHAKWLRLIIDSAIRALQKTPRKEPDVLFMLDEFPQLGRLDSIETSLALNAGYGVKILAVVQHLNQLVHEYGNNWETFLSGGAIASFAPRDYFTSEHLSKLSGQEFRLVESTSIGTDGKGGKSRSQQLFNTMLPHELRRLPRGDMTVLVPTRESGQDLRRTVAPDFSELPEVARHIKPVA